MAEIALNGRIGLDGTRNAQITNAITQALMRRAIWCSAASAMIPRRKASRAVYREIERVRDVALSADFPDALFHPFRAPR